MSVKEFSLHFTQLSKYSPKILFNSRASINKFVIRVSRMLVEECRTIRIHHHMDIPRLRVYANKSKIRNMNVDGKGPRSDEPSQLKSKKRFFNQYIFHGEQG